MDNQKDNTIQSSGFKQDSLSQKNQEPISFFKKDESFVFIYKKTERLATAMYMITNLFSDNEPIKWSLRKKVSELLSFIVSYKNILPAGQTDFTNDAKTRVLEIVSLFEISYRSGLVSPMNFSILKEEFSLLINVIETSSYTYSGSQHQSFSESFFNVPAPTIHSKSEGDSTLKTGGVSDADTTKPKDPERNVLNRNNRQNIIINLLKKKKDLTIKDIVQTIKDCSEKTIQRELVSLISMGVIKKTGERRWSRYSLI